MKNIIINKEQERYIKESIEKDSVMGKISNTLRSEIYEDNTPISSLPIPSSLNKRIIEDVLFRGYNHAKSNFSDDIESVTLDKVINKYNKLVAICKKKEENCRRELEKLCVDIATAYFNTDNLQDATLECRLVNDLSDNDFHIEPNTMSDITYDDINAYKDSEAMLSYRKMSNVLSMGGAIMLYELLRDKFINQLFSIDEELPHLYSKVLKINEYLMYVNDYEISDKNNSQSGCVNVIVNEDDGNEIIAVGTLFPFLLIETFRGYFELMSDDILSTVDNADDIIDKCDVLKDEPWQMIIGPHLWYRIVGDKDNAIEIMDGLYKMEPTVFTSFISEVLAGTKAGEDKLNELQVLAKRRKEYSDFEKTLDRKRKEHNLIYGDIFGNPLNESIDEAAYPETFNMEEFKTIRSFAERVRYCKARLHYLGKGSSRIVFRIDDTTVLKLAWNQKGIAQNEAEAAVKNDYVLSRYDFIPEVYDVDENYYWIEMAYARRANQQDFKRLTGYPFKVFYYWVIYVFNNSLIRNRAYARYIPDEYKRLFDSDKWEDTYEYSLFDEINDYMCNYDVQGWADLCAVRNWGVQIDKDGTEKLVLIDSGLSNDVLDAYYKK